MSLLLCETWSACSYEGPSPVAVELVAPVMSDSLVTFAGPKAMRAIQASGLAKPIGLSSFRTVLASTRSPNRDLPAGHTVLAKLSSFPHKEGLGQQSNKGKETPLTMSFANSGC